MEVKGKEEDIRQPQSKSQNYISDLTRVINIFNIKTPSDGRKCFISSMVQVNEDTLACIDWQNSNVKLLHTKRREIKGNISLPSPWDLACLPDNRLAVTLVCSKKIQFLSTKDEELAISHTISVDGSCRGIAYSKNRLYVTYENDPKVEIMTLEGKVLHSFKYDHSGWPLYVALSNDESFMYVSDSSARSVIKLSAFDGKVIATYTDDDLKYPKKLAVCKDGSVLVCNPAQSNLHLISSECIQVKIFFDFNGSNDAGECLAICYDDQVETLGTFPKELNVRVNKDGTADLFCSHTQNKLHLQPSECAQVKVVFEKNVLGECWAICIDDHTKTLFVGLYGGKEIKAYTMK